MISSMISIPRDGYSNRHVRNLLHVFSRNFSNEKYGKKDTSYKRRIHKKISGDTKPILSLSYFILRSQVLQQYRTYQRLLKKVSERNLYEELHHQIRSQYEFHRDVTNEIEVKQYLREGQQQMKELQILVDSSHSYPLYLRKGSGSSSILPINNSSSYSFDTSSNSNLIDLNDKNSHEMDADMDKIGTGWPWLKSVSNASTLSTSSTSSKSSNK